MTVEKEGYQFEQDSHDSTLFHSKVLSFLSVTFKDDKTEEPLSNVAVSISSQKGYREVVYTNDHGKVSFVDLYAGKYFLLPVLKEYKFSPAKITVEIEEGEQVQKEVQAKKVAFSVYGTVKLLSGQAAKNVKVTALAGTEVIADAETDENGQYRIKAL